MENDENVFSMQILFPKAAQKFIIHQITFISTGWCPTNALLSSSFQIYILQK